MSNRPGDRAMRVCGPIEAALAEAYEQLETGEFSDRRLLARRLRDGARTLIDVARALETTKRL